MKKPTKDDIVFGLQVAGIIVLIAIIGLCAFLKIWVYMEYGDMPITEVPTWAIPWLTNGR